MPCYVLHIECALYYLDCALLPVLRCLHLLGRVDLGDEFNLTSEVQYLVIVSKASTPSLIMSIKSQFPLILAYACLGCHHDMFYR